MTRDEAMRILADTVFPGEQREGFNLKKSGALIDAWAKLGMLKLDEPKSVEDRFDEIAYCYGKVKAEAQGMRNMLAKAGLKIVEA